VTALAGLLLAAAVQAAPAPAAPQTIPAHPDALVFKPVAYTPPRAADHRVVLKNGMVVFIAEDRTLPLVEIVLTVRTGGYLDPAGQEGLAALTGALIRTGGTRTLAADQLDERLDFLAARVSSSIGETAGTATLNCLAENLDASLKVFVEMLKEPRFQEDRLALAREQALQEMTRRNDDPEDIERREWNVLLYGEGRAPNRFTTEASLRSISRDDLQGFHRRYFHPAGMIAAVSGAFSRADMIRKLEAAFAGWPGSSATAPTPMPSRS
jgi:zinc protease